MMMAHGKRNKDEAPAKKQELDVWAEDDVWHLLGGGGSWVSKVVVLSH